MMGLIWVQIVWKGYQQMTMSFLSLTQSWNTSVQLQLFITSKVSNSFDTYQVLTECWAWSGSKLFTRVISRWQRHVKVKRKVKIHWFNFNLSVPLNCQKVWTPIRSRENVGPDLGPNCLKGLSADDNVMFKFNAKLKYIGSTSTWHHL